uniref:Thionin-like protein 2 n=1 Tax=Lactuca sativa TaxID=4236 RepID=A0A9R1VWG3_LACSA|nr:hypothetical protein LSAT_V11C400198110 [Lactuca sativa]
MEGKKMVKVMMMIFNIIMMVMGMVCLFFCLIEPQNMCTCTSTCLKKCLDTPSNTMAMAVDGYGENFGYCKLGCATSLCSNISKPHNLDGESMGRCVDSCSNKCTMSYYLAP